MKTQLECRVLVTGAAGFIGSHLSEKLLSMGYSVVGLDNLEVGRKQNLSNCLEDKNFSFYEIDILDDSALNLIQDEVDVIFHLAALADIVPSVVNPLKYLNVNVQGTINVLEFARRKEVKRILYTASSSCYGLPTSFPTNENAAIDPQYPYALSKFLGEASLFHWSKVYKLDAVSLRLFNVYGPRARTSGTYGAVFGVFLAQKYHGKQLTIVGDGSQTRDFTYVSDVVDALVVAAFSRTQHNVYNVGSGGTYSILDLANVINPGGKHEFIPKRPGEPDCTFADISRITEDLNWRPQVSFENGVNTMLKQVESWSSAPVWDKLSIEEATRSWFKYLGKIDER